MNKTFKILKFTHPYLPLIALNTLFNFLSVLFSLFSISLIIPILGILFNTIETPVIHVEEFSLNNLKNYFYNYVSSIINEKGDLAALAFVCVLVGIGTVLKNVTRYLALYCLTPIRNNVIRDIREKMYSQLLQHRFKFLNKFKKGDLVARMTNDLVEIEWSIMGVLEFFIKDPIHIILFLITLIYISPQLTLIALIFIPFTALIITGVSKSLKRSSLLSQDKIAEVISTIEESITNLKIIKAFNSYKLSVSNFDNHNEDLKNINNRVLWRKDLASPMSEMLSTLVIVAVIWFGGKIVLTSSLEADVFIGFLLIFSQILPPAKSLTTAFYSIQKGAGAVERVLVILERKTKSKIELPSIYDFKDSIQFKNVYFKYDEVLNLEGINLKIKKGEKVAIVGESGSGKSTLIELLLKFHNVSEGMVVIDDNNINDINPKGLFSLVSQDVMLFNDTILNNLRIGKRDATKKEIEQATKESYIHDIIKNLDKGYNTIIGPKGTNLSGGEKQRLSIARALISGAPILIFDEPTSALDSESHNYIQNKLMNLDNSKTLITITHKLHAIEDYDYIIVIKKGKIVEQGKHAFLLEKNGVYKKLYEIETLKSSNEKN